MNGKCKPSKINPSNKGCCPPDEVWNGTQCTIGCLGDPCDSNEECGTAGQCGTSKDLKCNPTTTEFSGYEKACCPDYKEWNGTDCVFMEERLEHVFVEENGTIIILPLF